MRRYQIHLTEIDCHFRYNFTFFKVIKFIERKFSYRMNPINYISLCIILTYKNYFIKQQLFRKWIPRLARDIMFEILRNLDREHLNNKHLI